jgi:hypothetical protein
LLGVAAMLRTLPERGPAVRQRLTLGEVFLAWGVEAQGRVRPAGGAQSNQKSPPMHA